jgi:hypothetical protein
LKYAEYEHAPFSYAEYAMKCAEYAIKYAKQYAEYGIKCVKPFAICRIVTSSSFAYSAYV